MDLDVWLNFISPTGPCFDPATLPIPGNPVSLAMIDALVERYVTEPTQEIRVLEVGSFCGMSALAWGHALKRLGVASYSIYCVDMWYHFGDIQYGTDSVQIGRQRNAFNHDIFKFNIAKAGLMPHVVEVIGDSRVALSGLRSSFFDFVYIDGFHGHDIIAQDIANGFRLCKVGGVVCGDDYDCPHDLLATISEEDRQRDCYLVPPASVVGVHPGVVLAVDNLLGLPRQYGSFWAFEKFTERASAPFVESLAALDVSAFPRRMPEFIPAELQPRFEGFFAQTMGFPVGHPLNPPVLPSVAADAGA